MAPCIWYWWLNVHGSQIIINFFFAFYFLRFQKETSLLWSGLLDLHMTMKDGLIWKDQLICSIRQVTFFPLNLYVRGYIWRNREKQEHQAGWVCSYINLRTLKTMFLHCFLLNLWAVPVQSLQLKSYLQWQSFFLRFKEVFGWWKHFTICIFCLFVWFLLCCYLLYC